MNNQKSKLQNNYIFFLTLAFAIASIYFQIFYFKPFWGLMDDNSNRVMARGMLEGNFLELWRSHYLSDLWTYGRLRAWYFPMIALIYGPAGENSLISYSINAAIVIMTFIFLGFSMGGILKLLFGSNEKYWAALFLCFSIAYPWSNHLFISLSLQEKLVLLAGAFLLWITSLANKLKGFLPWLIVWIISLALAINSKEQIVIFFPLILAYQLALDRSNFKRTATLLLIFLISLFGLWLTTKIGDYRSRYGADSALATIRNSKSLWIFLTLALGGLVFSFFEFRLEKNIRKLILMLSFPACLMGFLVILVPWGLGHYLNTSALPFTFLCTVLIGRKILTHWPRATWMSFGVLALLSLPYTYFPAFSAYGDIRSIFDQKILEHVEGKPIYMAAEEGREMMSLYAKWYGKFDLTVNPGTEISEDIAVKNGGIWIVSSLRAHNSIDFSKLVRERKAMVLFQGRFDSGFWIYQL